ncbi:hypothetical protein L195_g001136 [Trifolium pratense]|uniref:Uncharacterized protein n=1 Tax=Trifolium pratense TaxID=57577 RepID=A0A2K3NNW2_TRIPR|nr:hypothetical protein L195_g001136 [Trifolium pratense]
MALRGAKTPERDDIFSYLLSFEPSLSWRSSETLVVTSATSRLEMEKKDKVKGSMRRVCEVKRENNRVGDIETKVIRKNNTICGGYM